MKCLLRVLRNYILTMVQNMHASKYAVHYKCSLYLPLYKHFNLFYSFITEESWKSILDRNKLLENVVVITQSQGNGKLHRFVFKEDLICPLQAQANCF